MLKDLYVIDDNNYSSNYKTGNGMKSYNEILNEMDHISRYESICNRLEDEPIYLLNQSEKIALRSVPPGDEFYARKEGGKEFEIDYLSRTVVNAIGDAIEITKETYEKF